ncbi:MAG: hypothetical protein OQK24_09760 [Magnetovibrio sp.]|nr:hypothetical protein [Magnetovibrio sp.]
MDYLDNLNDIPMQAKICLYGAGDYGISLFRLIEKKRSDVEVVCFVDGFKTADTCGLKTITPQELLGVEYDFVVIASHLFEKSISENLRALGVAKFVGLNTLFNSKYAKTDYYNAAPDYADDVLYAFYDFSVSPYGFDFIFFLYLAEIERQKLGVSKIHPVLVPAPTDMLIQDDGTNFEEGMSSRLRYANTNNWWYRNIIVPTTWLLESCNQLTVCNSRDEAWDIFTRAKSIYPGEYSPHHPVQGYSDSLVVAGFGETEAEDMPSLKATPMALQFVEQWVDNNVGGRKLIPITLREAPFSMNQDKNSNIAEWVAFAQQLNPDQYYPVFVRDTSMALETLPDELSDCVVFPEAPWNLDIRMGLYQLGYLNMFVGNGPGMLCLLNRENRALMFQRPGSGNVKATDQLKIAGVAEGDHYPNLGKFQRILFAEKDNADIIRQEFDAMCERIETEAAQ